MTSVPARGQAPALSFQRLTLQQGLAASFTVAIAQDQPGFIWIATVNGLTRFDGLRCQTFTRQAGNPQSLSHRVVRAVYTARDGTLWVGTQEGLNRLEPDRRSFRRYSFAHLGAGCDFIRNIAGNSDDTGICWFNPTVNKFHSLFDEVSYQPVNTQGFDAGDLGRDSVDSSLWLATRTGVAQIDPRTRSYRLYHHDPNDSRSLLSNLV